MGKVYTCLTHRWIEQLIRTINETYDLNRWRIVNVFHDGRDYVAVLERDKYGGDITMSPDERIKELKKQGYISGVMAGKRIWERIDVYKRQAIDTSIGEIPKPKPVSMGAYSTVGSSGVAATDGFITSKSYGNTSITAYVNGLQVMHTAGPVSYTHLIFAAQCCFIWYQIAVFASASRKK